MRQAKSKPHSLPLKDNIVTDPQIQFIIRSRKTRSPNGKEIEYGYGRVAGLNRTEIDLFGAAAKHDGRWYLERMSLRSDELKINHMRGIFGSKSPIWFKDKSYPLPDGWVQPDETSLLPGMPVQYFDEQWQTFKPAEFLSGRRGRARILYLPGKDGQAGETRYAESKYVIAAVETLKQGEKDPAAFRVSVRLLSPESDVLLPENFLPVTSEMPLVPGTPIKQYIRTGPKTGWVTRIVMEPIRKNSVRVMHDEWHRWWKGEELTRYAIEKAVLDRLQQPGAELEYEPLFVDALEQGAKQLIAADVRTYSITLPHPEGYIPLPENAFVARGTRLIAEEKTPRSLKTGTALVDSQAGPVVLVWDGSPNDAPEALQRSSMLMFNRKAVPPQPGTFEVVLLKSGERKVRVARAITEIAGVDLKDALEILREAPISLRKNLTEADAKRLQQQLEAAGGTAKVQPMSSAP